MGTQLVWPERQGRVTRRIGSEGRVAACVWKDQSLARLMPSDLA